MNIQNNIVFDHNRPIDVICMGRIAVDLYAEQIGCTLAEAQTFRKYLGGCAGNIAVGLARLGLHSAMLSCIGQDEMGNFVKQTLQNEGVITDCLRATPDHLTGLAVLGVDPPEHFPLLFYRQNCADMQLQPGEFADHELATGEAMSRVYEQSIYPFWWKIAGDISATHWSTLADILEHNDPHARVILLGGQQMEIASFGPLIGRAKASGKVSGFAIGRSIFWQPWQRFLKDDNHGNNDNSGKQQVVKIRHYDTLKILHELYHAHVAAPGYGMYYIWVIRHLENNPYAVPEFTEEHAWTQTEAANARVWQPSKSAE